MNMAYFSLLAEREYTGVVNEFPAYPYSLETVLSVFSEFFRSYERYRGEPHPPLKRGNIRRYILLMPYTSGSQETAEEIDEDLYPCMIESYFNAKFKGCDYRIGHFFSGDIRLLRVYETMYE